MIPHRIALSCLAATALTASLSACNVFSPLDNPSGDAQLISAARACLDRGDYECAMSNYGKLSSSSNDIQRSEQAYTLLAQNGASFGTFAAKLGTDPDGTGLTNFAEALSQGSGEAKRLAIYDAHSKANGIQDAQLKALTKFLTASALASEILGEVAGTDHVLKASEIAAGGAACDTDLVSCSIATECDSPAGTSESTPMDGDTAGNELSAAAPSGATPKLDDLYFAVKEIADQLEILDPRGGFGSALAIFRTIFDSTGGNIKPSTGGTNSVAARCFRATLINQGIGEK